MREARFKHPSVCGMHQPFPDPIDIGELDPVDLLLWLTHFQKFLAWWPWCQEASVTQERPGIYVVGDASEGRHTIVLGLDKLYGSLIEGGVIDLTPDDGVGPRTAQLLLSFIDTP